jgi:hypothetical protein
MIDVQRVDLFDFGPRSGPHDRILFDLLSQFVAHRHVENLLGVIQPAQLVIARQNHGGSYDRTGQWRHAGFIHAGNEIESLIPKFDFEPKEVVETLALSAILSPTFADLPGEMMSTVARVGLERFDQAFGDRTCAIDKPLAEFGNRFAEKLLE